MSFVVMSMVLAPIAASPGGRPEWREYKASYYLPAEGRWVWQNPLPQGNSLYSVFFVDASTGWAVGSGGTILRYVPPGGAGLAYKVVLPLVLKANAAGW